jgi:hypothetical protein
VLLPQRLIFKHRRLNPNSGGSGRPDAEQASGL